MSTRWSLASRSGEGFEENAGAYEGLVEELRDRMREARRGGSEKRAVLWCVRIDDSPEGDGELASFSSPAREGHLTRQLTAFFFHAQGLVRSCTDYSRASRSMSSPRTGSASLARTKSSAAA